MTTTTLVLSSDLFAELESAARLPLETAGVLLVSVVETPSGLRLLGRKLCWVTEAAYARREPDSLSITSDGYVPALGEAERLNAAAIWLHTHPGIGSSPYPSRHDVFVDTQLHDLFRLRSGSPYYASLIVAPTSESITFSGSVHKEGGEARALDRLWMVGERFKAVTPFGASTRGLSPAFDRNVRAFGSAIQETLRDLHIGVIGCGGTGSAVAEQLARLGVARFTLVDPETLALTNVTRLYGSTPQVVGKPKVAVVGDHLRAIQPEVEVAQVQSTVNVESVARALAGCDVVFGCTDDNAGRLVLSRIATYLLLPVIDCGVLLSATADSQLAGIDGRVTTLVPGQACLVCRGRIDLSRAAAEALTPSERKRRVDEGYAPALGNVEPAVVAFTTAVAAAAVSELLERLIGFGPSPRPSEVLLRLHEREISTNRALPRDGHYCSQSAGKMGIGVTQPFLDQTWLS